jgi:hypothetical protein
MGVPEEDRTSQCSTNAGRLLLDGVNPYVSQVPTKEVPAKVRDRMGPYAYPPQFSSITISFAAFTVLCGSLALRHIEPRCNCLSCPGGLHYCYGRVVALPQP